MALALEGKKAIVESVNDVAKGAVSAVIANYRGLTVSEMTEMRIAARQQGVTLRVVRNTLAKRAVENTDFSSLSEALVGPTILAFSHEEPSAAAKLLREFSEKFEPLEVTALSVGGELLDAKALSTVASLPTKDGAISQLMSVMKAPITKLVQTLAAPHTKLVRTLVAVGEQKKEAG